MVGVIVPFSRRRLRSLAGTHPRSLGDSEAENLGLMLLLQAPRREDMLPFAAVFGTGQLSFGSELMSTDHISWSRAQRVNLTSPEERWLSAASSPRESPRC